MSIGIIRPITTCITKISWLGYYPHEQAKITETAVSTSIMCYLDPENLTSECVTVGQPTLICELKNNLNRIRVPAVNR